MILVCHHSAGPPRSPRKWRQFRTSHPPGTARPHSDLRMTSLRWHPPAALESGDSFAVCSRPQGWRGPALICVKRHSAGTPSSHRNQRQFRSSQPPGTARPHSGLRMTPRRWASQELTNVATVSQIAAPQGRPGLDQVCLKTSLRWPSQEVTKLETPLQIAAPPGTARSRSDPRRT